MSWVFVVLSVLANAAASVLVKSATSSVPAGALSGGSMMAMLRPSIVVALVCYGLAFVFYTAAVSRLPLNVAHPTITASAIVMVGLASAWIFHERFNTATWLGYGCLILGVIALSIARSPQP
jgi:multidrug transporter EmrE-like cation transporter